MICLMWQKASVNSCLDMIFHLFFPYGVILWLLDKLLRDIVIFKLNFSEMRLSCVPIPCLLLDIKLFLKFPMILQLRICFQLRLELAHRMRWVSRSDELEVIRVYDLAPLLHDTELTLGPRGLNVPDEFIFVTLIRNKL